MIHTNIDQFKVIQKIASYFHYSKLKVREALDPVALERNILSFPEMADSDLGFTSTFYVASGKFNLGQILDYKKFQKTALYDMLQLSPSVPIAYCTGGEVLIIDSHHQIQEVVSDASIVLQADYLASILSITPIQAYLKAKYPRVVY